MAEREITTETMSINDITLELERLGETVAELDTTAGRLRGEMEAAVAARTAARERAQAARRWSRERRTAERDADRADRIAAERAQRLQEVQRQAAEVVYRRTVLAADRSHKQWEQAGQRQELREKDRVAEPSGVAADRPGPDPDPWGGPLPEEDSSQQQEDPLHDRLRALDPAAHTTQHALEAAARAELAAAVEAGERDRAEVYDEAGRLRDDALRQAYTDRLQAKIAELEEPPFWEGPPEELQERPRTPEERHVDDLYARLHAIDPQDYTTADALERAAIQQLEDRIERDELDVRDVYEPGGILRTDVVDKEVTAMLEYEVERREAEAGIRPPERSEADRGQAEQPASQEQEPLGPSGLPLPPPIPDEEREDQMGDRYLAMLPAEEQDDPYLASDAIQDYTLTMMRKAGDLLLSRLEAEEMTYDEIHTPQGRIRQDLLRRTYLDVMQEDLAQRERDYDQRGGPGAREEREEAVQQLREERWARMEQIKAEIAALQARQRDREQEQETARSEEPEPEQEEAARGPAEQDAQQRAAHRDDRGQETARSEEPEQPSAPQRRQEPAAGREEPARGPVERGPAEAPPVVRQEPVAAPPPIQIQAPAAPAPPSRGAEPEL